VRRYGTMKKTLWKVFHDRAPVAGSGGALDALGPGAVDALLAFLDLL
jgi:hypothetical protein